MDQAAANSIAYPPTTAENAKPTPNESINWIILGAIALVASIAIVTMFRVFKNEP
jgi:hypothetical protein